MTSETGSNEENEAARVHCPVCIALNEPSAHFCAACGGPISAHSTLDPIKQIYATGWMYRKALTGEVSPIIYLGLWLIFGPTTVLTVAGLIAQACGRGGRTSPLSVVLQLGFLSISAIILLRATRGFIRHRRHRRGTCVKCGYDLRGLDQSRCPKCGTRFYADDVEDDATPDDTGSPLDHVQ